MIRRGAAIDLRAIDGVLAVALSVGAVLDAFSQPHRELGAVAILALLVLTGSVAWRRVDPAGTTLAAISGVIAFTVASDYNGPGKPVVLPVSDIEVSDCDLGTPVNAATSLTDRGRAHSTRTVFRSPDSPPTARTRLHTRSRTVPLRCIHAILPVARIPQRVVVMGSSSQAARQRRAEHRDRATRRHGVQTAWTPRCHLRR